MSIIQGLWFASMTHNIKLFILVQVQVACALCKIAQVCNLLVCNELFIVGWSIVSFFFKEAITIINIAFKIKFIVWSSQNKMDMVMHLASKHFVIVKHILMVHIFLFQNLLDHFVRIIFTTKLDATILCVKIIIITKK